MKCFKLTDQDMQTHGGFRWRLHYWAPTLSGIGGLCGSGWYHAYDSPLVAVMLNLIHAGIQNPRLFEASYDGRMYSSDDAGLKRGVRRLRLDKEMELPTFTDEQGVRFAIYCAREVHNTPEWARWAEAWLDGTDRTPLTAGTLRDKPEYDCASGTSAAMAARDALGAARNCFRLQCVGRAAYFSSKCGDRVEKWVKLILQAVEDENKFQLENTT